ncbi:LysE/ArgO family amino acid transporter [Minwuia sp.]|uniref:LysE/ArgO family amino acid transporter n=1 Tax=Minwuia sp. TaxID=2493630 RepID=UPI003A8F8EBA
MTAAVEGFLLGLSLILAIGAQNAFVLRQGLLRQHVLLIVLICAASDALLIGAGVMGLGSIIRSVPGLIFWSTLGGVVFLTVYGLFAFWRALRPDRLEVVAGKPLGWQAAALTTLAFTFLNPHVYLDTVIMLGGISARLPIDQRMHFWIGGATASFVFFFSLGYGARLLAPVFARPSAWRVLDLLIALVMWVIALILAVPLFQGGTP